MGSTPGMLCTVAIVHYRTPARVFLVVVVVLVLVLVVVVVVLVVVVVVLVVSNMY